MSPLQKSAAGHLAPSCSRRRCGKRVSSRVTTVTPAFSAAAYIFSASALLIATGFSQSMCFPASAAAYAYGAWRSLGTARSTAPTDLSAQISSAEAYVRRPTPRAASARAGSMSYTPATPMGNADSPSANFRKFSAWYAPIPPYPMIARFIAQASSVDIYFIQWYNTTEYCEIRRIILEKSADY